MINEFVREIQSQLLQMFPQNQIRDITGVIVETSKGYSIQKNKDNEGKACCNEEWLKRFLSSKSVEGCSSKTISYYETTIRHVLRTVDKPIVSIDTDDLRTYLYDYQKQRGSSKITIDNIRRILSSFFSWLEDEELIIRSPVRRIHKKRPVVW